MCSSCAFVPLITSEQEVMFALRLFVCLFICLFVSRIMQKKSTNIHRTCWKSGTWKGGTWKGGLWKGGSWRGGSWKGGTWNLLQFLDGTGLCAMKHSIAVVDLAIQVR